MPRRLTVLALSLAVALVASEAASASFGGSDARPVRRRVAAARGEGFYERTLITARVGYSAPTGRFSNDYDSGPGFGGSIGYGVSRNVVLSLGLAYHHFDNIGTRTSSASVTPLTVDADVVLPSRTKVKPWIGGGLGWYRATRTSDAYTIGDIRYRYSASENDFGLNFGVGLSGHVSPRTMIGGGVRYHRVWGDTFIDTTFFTLQMGMGFLL